MTKAELSDLLEIVTELRITDSESEVWRHLIAARDAEPDADLRYALTSLAHGLRAALDAYTWPSHWAVVRVVPGFLLPAEVAAFAADPDRYKRIAAATALRDKPPVIPGVVWRQVAAERTT